MKIKLIVIVVAISLFGCNAHTNKDNKKDIINKDEVMATRGKNNIISTDKLNKHNKLEEVNELLNKYSKEKDKIIQNTDFAVVFDITDYNKKEVNWKYHYYIYNSDKTKIIDDGIVSTPGYIFEKTSNDIIRGKRSLGSNQWECIYYNQDTGEKSKVFSKHTVVIEVDEYAGYFETKGKTTYLTMQKMFNKQEKHSYKLGEEDYIPGLTSIKYKDGFITVKNGDNSPVKKIDIRNIVTA